MRFEIPEFDESKNPNIPHEPPSKDLWRMLRYFAIIILGIYLTIEAIVFSLPYMIDVEREQRWFGSVGEMMVDDAKPNAELQKIADDLAVKMNLPANIVKIYISPSDDINAYATFGGHIVFHQGLLNQMPNEEAIVGILAHEMAHVQHRDVLRGSSRGLLFSLVISSITGSNQASMTISQLDSLRYSRQLEEQADAKAVEMLHLYYGSVGGMVDAFRELEKMEIHQSIDSLPSWILTHPKPEQRIQAIYDMAQKQHYRVEQGSRPNRWQKTVQKNS